MPIGDPEKSRIDPELSGMWLMDGGDGDPAVTLFEPYDKRTWLISHFPISENVESCDWDGDVVQPEHFALFENTITSVIYDMFEK